MTLKAGIMGVGGATAGFILLAVVLLAGCPAKNPLVGNWNGGVRIEDMAYPVMVDLAVRADGTFDAKASTILGNETLHTLTGTYSRSNGFVNVSFNDEWLAQEMFAVGYTVKRGKLTLTYAEDTVVLKKVNPKK